MSIADAINDTYVLPNEKFSPHFLKNKTPMFKHPDPPKVKNKVLDNKRLDELAREVERLAQKIKDLEGARNKRPYLWEGHDIPC